MSFLHILLLFVAITNRGISAIDDYLEAVRPTNNATHAPPSPTTSPSWSQVTQAPALDNITMDYDNSTVAACASWYGQIQSFQPSSPPIIGDFQRGGCELNLISVKILYFPTRKLNSSHPSTIYVPEYDKTFTSPSVYMVWPSIAAYNLYDRFTPSYREISTIVTLGSKKVNCALSIRQDGVERTMSTIKPALTNVIRPFDVQQVITFDFFGIGMSSVMEYLKFGGSVIDPKNTGMPLTTAPSSQLKLSDLYSECPSTEDRSTPSITRANGSEVAKEDADYLPLLNSKNHQHFRCNPFIQVPTTFSWLGDPWKSCWIGANQRYWGLPDPPYALEFDPIMTPIATSVPQSSILFVPVSTQPAAPLPVGDPGLAPMTSLAEGGNQPSRTDIPAVESGGKSNGLPNANHNPAGETSREQGNSQPGSGSLNNADPAHSNAPNHEDSNLNPGIYILPGKENTVAAVSVQAIYTHMISAGINSNELIFPGGATLKHGNKITLPVNGPGAPGSVAYSINEAGYLIVSTVDSGKGTTSRPYLVQESNTAHFLDQSTVVYMGQTLTKGGPVATLSGSQNAVVTYGPFGVIIQYPNGIVSTVPVRDAISATESPGNEAAMGSLIGSVMNGGGSPAVASKSSIPGQVLVGKPTTSADPKVGIQIAEFTGESSDQQVNVLLCVVLVGLALIGQL